MDSDLLSMTYLKNNTNLCCWKQNNTRYHFGLWAALFEQPCFRDSFEKHPVSISLTTGETYRQKTKRMPNLFISVHEMLIFLHQNLIVFAYYHAQLHPHHSAIYFLPIYLIGLSSGTTHMHTHYSPSQQNIITAPLQCFRGSSRWDFIKKLQK